MALWTHERGRGRDVMILLHPGPGADGSVFFPWFDALDDDWRLVAPDLPGNGRSDDGDRSRWNLDGYAEAVHTLADERGLRRYVLLGHSFGSWVALRHAINYPGEARAVVASCGAASLAEDVLPGLEARVAALEPAQVRDQVVAAFQAEKAVSSPSEYRDVWIQELPFFVADPSGAALRQLQAVFSQVVYRPDLVRHEDWGHFDVTQDLGTVDVPVLAITGAEDRSTPPNAGRRIAQLCPRGEYAEVPRAGHFPYAENPGVFFSILADWLSRVAA